MRGLSVVLFLAALPRFLAAQRPADTLRALDSAWARAYATHDTTLAMALFAEDLVVTSASGARKTRAEELADVRPFPGLAMHYFRTTDVAVRMYESVGVVVGLAEWEFALQGQARTLRRSYTAVYVRGGPFQWRMVSLHLGNAPTPAAR
jgi:ketosteroid isomerase-like protein